MTRTQRVRLIGVLMSGVALMPVESVLAQTNRQPGAQQQQQSPPPVRGGRAGGRAPLPPIAPNMNQQQLQAYIDTYAVVQAERDLQLTADQYPTFVGRLRRMQDIRRRQQMDKRKLLGEMNGLLQGGESGRDEAILAHVKALDDLSQRTAAELQKAYQELDSGLTPWQRGRYRMFEEQLERRKIELLAKINGTPAAGSGK